MTRRPIAGVTIVSIAVASPKVPEKKIARMRARPSVMT